jgi:hypothetical protein
MRFAVEIQPRFDYGRKPHTLELTEDGGSTGASATRSAGGAPGKA